MTTSTLTFGSTFTLPATGDHEWKIRDTRPPFAHLASTGTTAYAKSEYDDHAAWYTPGEGWAVSTSARGKGDIILEQLDALNVDLPHRSAEEWAVQYRRMLAKETHTEVEGILALIGQWTRGTDIDPLDLKAHIAATSALAAAGTTDNFALYTNVYNATLTALQEQQA